MVMDNQHRQSSLCILRINVNNENNLISLSKATHSYCLSKHLNNLIFSGTETELSTDIQAVHTKVSHHSMENFGPFCICRRRTSLCSFCSSAWGSTKVFIFVLNGHEAAVTTVTAHESEGEGVVVIVDLGGSYRLQNFVLTSYLNLLLQDQKIEKT